MGPRVHSEANGGGISPVRKLIRRSLICRSQPSVTMMSSICRPTAGGLPASVADARRALRFRSHTAHSSWPLPSPPTLTHNHPYSGPVAVKAFETASHYVDAIFGCGVGGLIHAAVGSFGGCGGVPNRFGLAA